MSDVISDIPGHVADHVSEEIRKMTLSLINDLLSKWKAMYNITEEEKCRRIEKLVGYVKGYYDEISDIEEEKRVTMLNEIEHELQEFYELQKGLGISSTNIAKMYVKEPYSEFLNDIKKSMARFVKEKDERLERLKKLLSEEQELCLSLGCSPQDPLPNPVPTEDQLDALELRILELNEDKINRLRIYTDARSVIINLSKILEREPATLFEKDVHMNTEESYQPTTQNMKKLESLKIMLEKIHEQTIQKREDLLEKLVKLWDRLKIDSAYREEFLFQYPSISGSNMKAIECEIDRCERLKRENMRQVIESAREQIRELWDKLTYSEEQRQEFKPFTTDHYSEDVLDLHELEIQRLEFFYLQNQHIFELAEKRNELWERMLHLDFIAQDKTRLFNNRGGQLLKEEKERKALEVNLPKVDKQLKAALLEFGEPFYWHGHDLLQKITTDWEERIAVKESKKLARKALETEAILGSRPAANQQKRKGLPPTGGGQPKARRCELADRTITLKAGVRTPVALARTPLNTSTSSLASYSQFHEGIERSVTRSALKEVGNTPGIAHSSPTLVTPRRGTPASSKRTPQTIPRLTHCRKRLPINI
nr:protein regulator of cytokinesis 1-like isoform X2 [Halyomorpha halys]